MIYNRKADLKVECIVSPGDFAFFGATLDDVLERTQRGRYFLNKLKKLCAITQNVTWTNIAYTLNITMLAQGMVSFEFSECMEDYVRSLKSTLAMADEDTKEPLQGFIHVLEQSDEESGRKLVAHFENSIKNVAHS